MTNTLEFRVVDRVLVSVQSKEDPTDQEWDAYMDFAVGNVPPYDLMLVYSEGGIPNGKQRDRLAKGFGPQWKARPTVIVTPSFFLRAIVRMLNTVMNTSAKVFDSADMEGALTELGVTPAQRRAVIEAVQAMRRQLVVPES